MDLEQIRRTGLSAAYRAGGILKNHLGKIDHVRLKGAIDLVTVADTASEALIIETIRQRFPAHTILAEESGLNPATNQGIIDHRWIVDPLDGTTNFAHQVPLFAVSIAFAAGDEVLVGIVLNPVSGELFTAIKGQGAFLNGQPMRVSKAATAAESLLATGFPYNLRENLPALLMRFGQSLLHARGVRRLGSAALDLCFVACGRFDGFWEENLKPWDTAAGMLIAREAGATVTNFNAQPFAVEMPQILATNGRIHQEILKILARNT